MAKGKRVKPGMEWQQPPERVRYDWPEILSTLQSRPGEWLKVFDDGPISIVNAIRQGSITSLGPQFEPARGRGTRATPGWQVMTRNNKVGPPRTATLYLRWTTGQED